MIQCTREIEVSQKVLFDLTQDYGERLKWDPFPESYRFLNGESVRSGLQLEVVDKAGRSMTVVYISFKSPTVAAVKMIIGPWYIKSFSGSWSFKKVSENSTEVVFKYNISGKPSILGFPVRWVFRRNLIQRLDALKSYAESKI